jgi:hypothetical protein
MVTVGNTSGFTIDSSEFLRNRTTEFPSPMFSIWQSENVTIKNTKFVSNEAKRLIEQEGVKLDSSNTFENNTF